MANKIDVFPKEAVEGLIAESMGSIHETFMQLIEKPKDIKQIENARATWLITRSEVLRVISCLSPYTDASLQPKHCAARDVYKEMMRRLEATASIEKAKTIRHSSAIRFARDLVEFMATIHTVMHKETKYEDRLVYVEKFNGSLIDADINNNENYITLEVADA